MVTFFKETKFQANRNEIQVGNLILGTWVKTRSTRPRVIGENLHHPWQLLGGEWFQPLVYWRNLPRNRITSVILALLNQLFQPLKTKIKNQQAEDMVKQRADIERYRNGHTIPGENLNRLTAADLVVSGEIRDVSSSASAAAAALSAGLGSGFGLGLGFWGVDEAVELAWVWRSKKCWIPNLDGCDCWTAWFGFFDGLFRGAMESSIWRCDLGLGFGVPMRRGWGSDGRAKERVWAEREGAKQNFPALVKVWAGSTGGPRACCLAAS